MSGKVVGWAFDRVVGSPAAKAVLVKLADNANEDGFCWPSVPLIARHTELSVRTVREKLRDLEKAGLVVAEARITARGQASNTYQLSIPRPVPKGTVPPALAARDIPAGGAAMPGTSRPPSRHHLPGPKENLQKEPSSNLAPPGAPPPTGRAERLSQEIGPAKFDGWFGDAHFIDGEPVRILVPSKFKQNWIIDKFFSQLRRVFGDDVRVEICPQPPPP